MLSTRSARAAAALFILSSLGVSLARAEGTFISASKRVDMVYDDARGLLYITNGTDLLRYQLASQTFLAPVSLGGQLAGVDISPDGNTLAVADFSFTRTSNWIHLVDLNSLTDTKVEFATNDDGEAGTFSVAYGKDGDILVTAEFAGSGGVPLRRYDPATGKTKKLGTIRHDSMVQASANGKIIALEESQSSDGPFGKYTVKSKNLKHGGNTNHFNYEIGVDGNAGHYAVVSDMGTFIADKSFNVTNTLIGSGGAQPIAAAFHPTRHLAYFPWATTFRVNVYDTDTWTEVDSFNLEDKFETPDFVGYMQGREKLSKDGALLFVTVTGGVRYVETAHHHL